ncbi:MAG: ATPase [Tabrizicola sp.]|nr:ATPase [Tabrizicola sp.]
MQLVLGVDGGGTGCRAAVADLMGRILGRGEAGAANIATEPDAAAGNIGLAVDRALAQAGADRKDIRRAVLGLAGANLPGAPDRLIARLPFPETTVVTDAVTAARGALGATEGILAAIGTGSVFATQRGEVIRQFGGYGFLLGDEGSGAALGRALLSRALGAHDGQRPMTPLLKHTLHDMQGTGGIVAFATQSRPADFAALAPRVTESADPAALAILAEAEADVARMLDALQAGTGLPIVFLGGLGPHYAARFQTRFRVLPALGTGLDGALQLATGGL